MNEVINKLISETNVSECHNDWNDCDNNGWNESV